ncbi:MAG: hypothetical protein ACK4R9_14290 [Ignavibacterium sp.]
MKKFLITILVLAFAINLKSQDVRLVVPKLSIENSIKTFLDARAASFSSYTPGFGVDMYNVKLIYSESHPLILDLIPPNKFRIQCGIIGRANVNYLAGNFQINGEGNITIEGIMAVEGQQGQLTLIGTANAVIQVSGVPGFLLNIINSNQFTLLLPPFELATFVFTFPTIPLNYFTTNYPTINITNDNVILGLQTPSNFIIVDQKDQSGNRILNSSIAHWENNTFASYTVPGIFSNLPVNSWQTFRGDQEFQLTPFQKYNNWNNLSTVENHKKFYLDGSISRLNSNFKLTYSGITIKNSLELSSINSNDSIYFKDPWLIDYPDPLYGNSLRNRGMDAPFKKRPSPFYPDYTTSYNGDVYKGVFLNQNSTFDPTLPIYSVKADYVQNIPLQQTGRTHKFYFQRWDASPVGSATFQDSSALETPVVFNQENATVQANLKGTQLSNNPNAYSKGSQRKFIRITNGRLFSVYESMGNIYLERSTDNGAKFTILKSSKYNVPELTFPGK